MEGGLLWAGGHIVNVVNGICVIQKTFEALLCANTVLGSNVENNRVLVLRELTDKGVRQINVKAGKVWFSGSRGEWMAGKS